MSRLNKVAVIFLSTKYLKTDFIMTINFENKFKYKCRSLFFQQKMLLIFFKFPTKVFSFLILRILHIL